MRTRPPRPASHVGESVRLGCDDCGGREALALLEVRQKEMQRDGDIVDEAKRNYGMRGPNRIARSN